MKYGAAQRAHACCSALGRRLPEHPTVRDMSFFEFRFIIGDVDIDAAFETIRSAGKPDRIGQAQGVA